MQEILMMLEVNFTIAIGDVTYGYPQWPDPLATSENRGLTHLNSSSQ